MDITCIIASHISSIERYDYLLMSVKSAVRHCKEVILDISSTIDIELPKEDGLIVNMRSEKLSQFEHIALAIEDVSFENVLFLDDDDVLLPSCEDNIRIGDESAGVQIHYKMPIIRTLKYYQGTDYDDYRQRKLDKAKRRKEINNEINSIKDLDNLYDFLDGLDGLESRPLSTDFSGTYCPIDRIREFIEEDRDCLCYAYNDVDFISGICSLSMTPYVMPYIFRREHSLV